ncbi:DNA repair protein [Xanthobacter sp. V4C-4]|uniref:ImuA family protein n=1 Tax=Xanthobacter cornucopiae TaxID=3119924 RepID=UPI0037285FCA
MTDPLASRTAADLARLRTLVGAIERGVAAPGGEDRGNGGGVNAAAAPRRLCLGAPDVDAALGGGLACGALHEAAGAPGDEGALSVFALGLAALAARTARRPVLLAQQDRAGWEAGRLYGPGLAALGLPPEALLLVRVRKPQDVLFVMEEGLKCAGLSMVLGECLSPVPEVLTATRRLSLAVRGSGRLGLLLRHAADAAPSAALTRWRVSALPSPAPDGFGGLGPPRLSAHLTRNRFGPTGAWPLSVRDGRFHPAPDGETGDERGERFDLGAHRAGPALSQPGAPAPAHGPAGTADVA